jgi:hypothetical protein
MSGVKVTPGTLPLVTTNDALAVLYPVTPTVLAGKATARAAAASTARRRVLLR